jgi:hypothetical protein
VGFKCGILYKRDELMIKRIIFRMSRGLSVFHTLEEEVFGEEAKEAGDKKIIFYLFFGFGTSPIMQTKVNKTLEIYCSMTLEYPKNEEQL